jgi:FHS family L-fucose permease-like MFS transporter
MNRFREMFRTADGRNLGPVFALVCALFFLWGFGNGMIDVLNKQFQNSFHISKTESAFVQFATFIGYFVMAIPAGLLAQKVGYKRGILTGLGLIVAGALWFIPATSIGAFAGFLAGLFILASGQAILETMANPYTTVLGPPEMGATRINLAQSCNAIGTILGPILAGHILLSSTGKANTSNDRLFLPYLIIAGLVAVLIVVFTKTDVPDLKAGDDSRVEKRTRDGGAPKPLLARWHFTLAIVAQFFYVAAQIGIWGYFVNYVTSADMPLLSNALARIFPDGWTFPDASSIGHHITDQGASYFFSAGMICFFIGRLVGSGILRVCSAHLTLAWFALFNSIMMILIVLPLGWFSVAGLFLSFFGMSIMFPTIFALGIRGLGEHTKLGSSLLVMSIVGGAFMPFVMGYLADTFSMRVGFIMPLVCFVIVLAYAVAWPALERLDTGHDVAD